MSGAIELVAKYRVFKPSARYKAFKPSATYRVVAGTGGGESGIPDQTGNSGKFLTTDGSTVSWASPTATAVDTMARKLAMAALALGRH